MTDTKAEEQLTPITMQEFLTSTPPGTWKTVSNALSLKEGSNVRPLTRPALMLHCSSETCKNDIRTFRSLGDGPSLHMQKTEAEFYLEYICSNCRETKKKYAIDFRVATGAAVQALVFKFGEMPTFGVPTPTRLLKILGDQKDVFLKGRRCENQGLGIGAFSYYRRVVEHQRNRIIEEILKVASTLNAPQADIDKLNAAKNETQFKKSVEMIKDAIPNVLLINGHNPMTLLHSALSAGLHDRTDEFCLELAQDIRVVLVNLAENLSQALKDDNELKASLGRLMKLPNSSAAT